MRTKYFSFINVFPFSARTPGRGENLATFFITTGIEANRILEHGKEAVVGWFNESQYYKFGGESEDFNKCNMTDKTGHFTQVMLILIFLLFLIQIKCT